MMNDGRERNMPGPINLQRADLTRITLGLLRIMVALLMLAHPLQKFAGFPSPSRFGLADPLSLVGAAGIIEAVAGLLLLIGYQSRIAAFILSGTMAVAYFIVHARLSFFPIENGGELAILFCFTLLFISCAGAGAFSLDERRVGSPDRSRSQVRRLSPGSAGLGDTQSKSST